MHKTTLVEADIVDGERVVSALEALGVRITAAFWHNSDDEDDWHLIVVSPDVSEKGPREVYKQAFGLLHGKEPGRPENFWWDRVKIIGSTRLIYRTLRQRAGASDHPVRPGWVWGNYVYKMA
jgi:hypothetical protein